MVDIIKNRGLRQAVEDWLESTKPPDTAAHDHSLRKLRRAQAYSIRDLATEAQVAPSTVYLLEKGRVDPRPSTVRKLARVLGVEPSQINLSGNQPPRQG